MTTPEFQNIQDLEYSAWNLKERGRITLQDYIDLELVVTDRNRFEKRLPDLTEEEREQVLIYQTKKQAILI